MVSAPKEKCSKVLYGGQPSKFIGMLLEINEINISTEYNRLKNLNWREADQLAICKHDQELN